MLKLLNLFLSLAVAQTLPFWKGKAKIYERVQNGEVIVSVMAEPQAPPQKHYHLHASGGGQVAAPCDFALKSAQKYEETAKVSSYVTEAKYHPDSKFLDVTIEVFFHQATMENGVMRGFTWDLDFTEVNPRRCEIAFAGDFAYDTFPIPQMFLSFGLEAVFKHLAEQLRGHVEHEFKTLKS